MFALFLQLLLAAACATTHIPELAPPLAGTPHGLTAEQFEQHVLMFNARGKLLDPLSSTSVQAAVSTTGYRELETHEDEESYFQRVLDGIRKCQKANGRVQVLFFFHGGLNSRAAALQRAAKQIVAMRMEPGRPDLYPVFVNWETSLPASYKDHLFWVRNGQDTYKSGTLITPFIFTSDLARSVLDIPIAGYMEFKEQQRYREADPAIGKWRAGVDCQSTPDVRVGSNEQPTWGMAARGMASSVVMTVLTKWWAGGVLSAAGSSAWSSMLYTSDRLFYSDMELHHPYDYEGHVGGSGGLSRFFRELANVLTKSDDVVLVGHSAGAIVINRLIANFGTNLPISTLVYMAPACTIDEIMDGGRVTQFLRQGPKASDGQPGRRLYILALNERAEVNERWHFDMTPRGSLLAWLDEFIQPKHSEFPGMMLGRARNLRLHAHLIPCDIRPQIAITAFNEDLADRSGEPQTHGAFGDLAYWNVNMWRPEYPGIKQVTFDK